MFEAEPQSLSRKLAGPSDWILRMSKERDFAQEIPEVYGDTTI